MENAASTPMLRQYLKIKAANPDAILMFRLGDFYEMFFEDAKIASNILDITLTTRNRNDPNPVPLCGVPYHSVEPYIAKLLESGRKVAICDQMEDPRFAKGVVKREVTRVVTPGVVIDGLGLDSSANNFLASVFPDGGSFGLAVADASTGLFKAGEFPTLERLCEEMGRMEPREVLLPDCGDAALIEAKLGGVAQPLFTRLAAANFLGDSILALDGGRALAASSPAAARAAAGALAYLEATMEGASRHMRRVESYLGDGVMRLNEGTKRNLELVRTMQGERRGSLLDTIDRTATAGGARKLKSWLLFPLTDPREIGRRLDAVAAMNGDARLLNELAGHLSRIADMERITSRAATNLAGPRDLVGLKESLAAVAVVKGALRGRGGLLGELAAAMDGHEGLARAIGERFVDDPPHSVRDGGIIRPKFSAELDGLRDAVAYGKDRLAAIESSEREATGIGSLKVRYNRVFGYYIEVTNAHRDKVPDRYMRKQTLTGAERYITPELKECEEAVLGAAEKSKALEQEIFAALRSEVGAAAGTLLATADAVARLDALASLARVAAEHGYRRPEVDDGGTIAIKGGRHPIVERALGAGRFVPNDVLLDGSDNLLLMITGPNMAGKSTVMRQTALIVLLAQVGSFVPAEGARVGVADRIFTRVGASDELAQGKSTFMVEMSEAATILKEATARSLVIIDEIGRGTSTFDGLAIAWAVAEELHDRVRARTMFATHYHELTDLAATRGGIRNMHIAVKEWEGEVIFLRRLLPGATSRSYGIQVAKLAGLPAGTIERAREVLENLESGEMDEAGMPRIATARRGPAESNAAQISMFDARTPSEVERRIGEIDTHAITPIEALNILHELKAKV